MSTFLQRCRKAAQIAVICWKNKVFRGTILHTAALMGAFFAFSYLTQHHYLSGAPQPRLPEQYASIKPMEQIDLEQKLRAPLDQNAGPNKIEGLIVFDGLPAIVVERSGFDNDLLVARADVDEMVYLAQRAKIPVAQKKAEISIDKSQPPRPEYWWAVIFLTIWTLIYLFKKRDHGRVYCRVRMTYRTIFLGLDWLIKNRKWKKSKFYLTVWLCSIALLIGLCATRMLHDDKLVNLPDDIAAAEIGRIYQVERQLDSDPSKIVRATAVKDMQAVYVYIEAQKPIDMDDDDIGPQSKQGPQSPKGRTLIFDADNGGKPAFDKFVDTLKSKGVVVKEVRGVPNTQFLESMTKSGRTIFLCLIVFCLIYGITLWSNWSDMKQAELPAQERRQQPTAAAPTGNKTGTGEVVIAKKDRKMFKDVAGADEALAELRIVVQKIMHASYYAACNSEIPHGVMMYGDPGNGKTLLAKAVAGETGGAFFVRSGSEFINKYVGVGAEAVRETFKAARAAFDLTGKVSVVFIDEIDAIGKKRSGESEGAATEYNQTINQLLTEMDGFNSDGKVLVIAATNRLDILDEALLRSGRFDIKVQVSKPDRKGRAAIFGIYLAKRKIAEGDSLTAIIDECATRSSDMSGADIELAVKEASNIVAERHFDDLHAADLKKVAEKAVLTAADIQAGLDKVRYGTLLKGRVRSDKERRATAIHEIGHAAIPTLLGGDPVSRINIMMTTKSLGLMESHSQEDRYGWTREEFIIRIKTLLAGRIAEERIAGECSTGASNDFERASMLARQMVGIFGMSRELGVASIPLDQGGFPRGQIGNALMEKFTEAWTNLISECEAATIVLIDENRARIERCAEVLFREETLTGEMFSQLWTQDQ